MIETEMDAKWASLLAWSSQHGAEIHPSVEICQDEHTGLAFRVKPSASTNLPAGALVTSCPMATTLSYLNAITPPGSPFHDGNSPVFPSAMTDQLPPHTVGRLFLIKEYLRGEDSFWWPYIRNLPQPGDASSWLLPPFWPADAAELLEGTNLEVTNRVVKARLEREFKQAAKLLVDCGIANPTAYTLVLYQWAYCMFTSRSFTPSLVIPEVGSLRLPDRVAVDDFSILLPLMDIGNHSMAAEKIWEVSSQEQACRFVTLTPYEPGDQVYNNYGMKTNGQLLESYGFLVQETDTVHNDYLHVQKKGPAPGSTLEDQGQLMPQQFYISLRPMNDPQSVVGQAAQLVATSPAFDIHPAFAHIQDGLIWDIVCAQTTAEDRLELFPVADEMAVDPERTAREQLRQILTWKIAPAAHGLVAQTLAIIHHKVSQELEKLEETEYEAEPEGNLTKFQRLALYYRSQCRKLLEAALTSITENFPDDPEEEEEEENE